jgi:hypothetical protein
MYDEEIFKMWYAGFDQNYNIQIGYATSNDEVLWTKYSRNPVLRLGASGSWDSKYVFCPYGVVEAV